MISRISTFGKIISIHAPPRGATASAPDDTKAQFISIHAPPRGATDTLESSGAVSKFQFTPLREGRREVFPTVLRNIYFNSRPSARGDNHSVAVEHNVTISIHAPPRGATEGVDLPLLLHSISIHAPPRGATPPQRYLIPLQAISIHAPPRGATAVAPVLAKVATFQFTPLREGRRVCNLYGRGLIDFNSRPSARGDGKVLPSVLRSFYFNSRPSARGDNVFFSFQHSTV